MNINEIDIPEEITGEWLESKYSTYPSTYLGTMQFLADLWERDRTERAKNTIRIPDEKDWPSETCVGKVVGICAIYTTLPEEDWRKTPDVAFYISRTPKLTEILRAKLIAKINGASDDELAYLAKKMEGK